MFPPRVGLICEQPIRDIERLLDIGCGDGKYAVAFKESFNIKELYGIDIGGKALEVGSNLGINMSKTDLNEDRLPYDNDYFDFVFAGEIIEHLLSPDNLLAEVNRVLKDDGYFALTTPNIANWYDRMLLLFGWQPYSIPTHSVYRGVGTFLSKSRDTTIRDYRYEFTSGGRGLAHIQFFTFRSITALVKKHGFKITQVYGVPAEQFTFPINAYLRRLLLFLDKTISSNVKSLAPGIVIIAKKNGH